MMSVTIPQNTVILDVRVGSTDPERAALVANAIADSLIAAVDEVAPASDGARPPCTARSIDPASPATFQTSPNKQQDALLGAILGFLVASVALVLAAALDTRVRSEAALKAITELPVLGIDRADAVDVGSPTGGDPPAQRERGRGLPACAIRAAIRVGEP